MKKKETSTSLVLARAATLPITALATAVLERSGGNAVFAAEEFFKATINNPHTRRAYGRIVGRFLACRRWPRGAGGRPLKAHHTSNNEHPCASPSPASRLKTG